MIRAPPGDVILAPGAVLCAVMPQVSWTWGQFCVCDTRGWNDLPPRAVYFIPYTRGVNPPACKEGRRSGTS